LVTASPLLSVYMLASADREYSGPRSALLHRCNAHCARFFS
jgi:hypothetical protein